MKVILLSTGRSLRSDFIEGVRANMGLRDSDVVCVVSWFGARNPLPVSRHLVIGPHFRVRGATATVQRVQRRTELIAASFEQVPDATVAEAASRIDAATLPHPASLTDPASLTAPAGGAPHAASSTAHLHVLNVRRMRRAVAWRFRRLKKATRTKAGSRLTRVRRHPHFRKVRNRLYPSVSISFAANCLRVIKVHDMARDADLVVALDAASQRGAWTLAQKVPGPDVVIGIPAAKQIIEQRESLEQPAKPTTRSSGGASSGGSSSVGSAPR